MDGAFGWIANSCVSHGPPFTRSCHERPPSRVETSAPASMATQSCCASLGWQAIQRTWCVSGLGGNDHSGEDGSVYSREVCCHAPPPFSDFHTSLGSVPTQTRSRCAGLTAIDMMLVPSRPTASHDAPASSLRNTPPRRVPHQARPDTNGSAAIQLWRSSRLITAPTVPSRASIVTTVLSVATRISGIHMKYRRVAEWVLPNREQVQKHARSLIVALL